MPETSQRVVVNATPIIALSLIGKLDLLHQLYGEVLLPPAVRSEVLAGGRHGVGSAELREAPWLRAVSLQDPPRRTDLLLTDLDRGEVEVIVLAQEQQAELVILDERLARRHARRLGLSMTGTLGIFKGLGLVSAIGPLVGDLHQGGIRLSNAGVTETLKCAASLRSTLSHSEGRSGSTFT